MDDDMEIPSTLRKRLLGNNSELNLFDDFQTSSNTSSRSKLEFGDFRLDEDETNEETEAVRAFEKYLARVSTPTGQTGQDFSLSNKHIEKRGSNSELWNPARFSTSNAYQRRNELLEENRNENRLNQIMELKESGYSLKWNGSEDDLERNIHKNDNKIPYSRLRKLYQESHALQVSASFNDSLEGNTSGSGLRKIVEVSHESFTGVGVELTDREETDKKTDRVLPSLITSEEDQKPPFKNVTPVVLNQGNQKKINAIPSNAFRKNTVEESKLDEMSNTKKSHHLLTKYFESMLKLTESFRNESPNRSSQGKKIEKNGAIVHQTQELDQEMSTSNISRYIPAGRNKLKSTFIKANQHKESSICSKKSISSAFSKNSSFKPSPFLMKKNLKGLLDRRMETRDSDSRTKRATHTSHVSSTYVKPERADLFSEVFGEKNSKPRMSETASSKPTMTRKSSMRINCTPETPADSNEISAKQLINRSKVCYERLTPSKVDSNTRKSRKFSIHSVEKFDIIQKDNPDLTTQSRLVQTYENPSNTTENSCSFVVKQLNPNLEKSNLSSFKESASPVLNLRVIRREREATSHSRTPDRAILEPKYSIAPDLFKAQHSRKKASLNIDSKMMRNHSPKPSEASLIKTMKSQGKSKGQVDQRIVSEASLSNFGSPAINERRRAQLKATVRPGIAGKIDVLSRHLIQTIATKQPTVSFPNRSASNIKSRKTHISQNPHRQVHSIQKRAILADKSVPKGIKASIIIRPFSKV